jgi:hypothetical protein
MFSAGGLVIWQLMSVRWKTYWATIPDWPGARPDTGQDEAQYLQSLHSVGPLDWQDKAPGQH